jgi:hypothetical protein
MALYCIALYCIALYCIALYCIALHCIDCVAIEVVSEGQLIGMTGGRALQTESAVAPLKVKKKTTQFLLESLQRTQLIAPLFILMAQQKK